MCQIEGKWYVSLISTSQDPPDNDFNFNILRLKLTFTFTSSQDREVIRKTGKKMFVVFQFIIFNALLSYHYMYI